MDHVAPSPAGLRLDLAKPPQQEYQPVVLRDVIAPQGTVCGIEIRHLPHIFVPADYIGGPHWSLLLELIPGTRSVEETFGAGGMGRCNSESGGTRPGALRLPLPCAGNPASESAGR